MKSNQTTRVLELLKRFNNGEKICIDELIHQAKVDAKDYIPNLWLNSDNKPVSEKTIRRDLDVIKEFFDDNIELIRGGKGEKSCYKAITNKAFENFINPEVLSLMVQTFNLANKSNLFENFDLDDSDKRILESKVKETNKLYEFKSKPFETKKEDLVIFKKLEYSIKHQKYINIEYEKKEDLIEKYEVKPYKIVFINENFYLACEIEHEKLEFAMYRISKIKSIEDTSKTYHKNIEIEQFIKDMQTPFAFYKREYKKHLIDIVVEIDSLKAFYFEKKKHLKYQEIIDIKPNGNLIVGFKVTQELEIEELIKKWIPYVKVIEPLSLKKKIEEDIKTYLNL
jgi:predicted DNA-binding transcriptional regulator YafY